MVDQPCATFFPQQLDIILYSRKVPSFNQYENLDRGTSLVCTDPQLKTGIESGYNTATKLDATNWNQYLHYMYALLSMAVGSIHLVIITACKNVPAYAQAITTKDIVAFLGILRSVCSKDPNGGVTKHNGIIEDPIFLSNSLNLKQLKDASDINFTDQTEDRYNAITYLYGQFASGMKAWDEVLATHPISRLLNSTLG